MAYPSQQLKPLLPELCGPAGAAVFGAATHLRKVEIDDRIGERRSRFAERAVRLDVRDQPLVDLSQALGMPLGRHGRHNEAALANAFLASATLCANGAL